jgi:hypothetical protein
MRQTERRGGGVQARGEIDDSEGYAIAIANEAGDVLTVLDRGLSLAEADARAEMLRYLVPVLIPPGHGLSTEFASDAPGLVRIDL